MGTKHHTNTKLSTSYLLILPNDSFLPISVLFDFALI